MTVKTVPDGGGLTALQTRDVYYGYDVAGALLYARFDSATGNGVDNDYDSLGRLAATTNGTLGTLSYQYDAHGNRTRITHTDGTYFDTAYDALDRPTVASANGGAAVVTLGYDAQQFRGHYTQFRGHYTN